MTLHTDEMSTGLPCHLCEYDLRAHPQDGICPECGASVAESRRLAAIPLRPAWPNSDPRWRRRMLAGMWVLALLPLMDVLKSFDGASSVPVPTIFDFRGAVLFGDTFLWRCDLYPPLVFCIGVVLLFSKERGRRRDRFDWTCRWGVICSYVVLLLTAVPVLFISALVLAGISSLFMSMPLKYQPEVTRFFVEVSTAYIRFGPQSKDAACFVHIAFSSIAILLACIPLFNALRSSGPKQVATILLAPLALFSLMHVAQAIWYGVGLLRVSPGELSLSESYFRPDLLVSGFASLPASLNASGSVLSIFIFEAAKWCIVLAIAVWLTIAQVAAWWQRKRKIAA